VRISADACLDRLRHALECPVPGLAVTGTQIARTAQASPGWWGAQNVGVPIGIPEGAGPAFYGSATLVGAAVLGLATALEPWVAAFIVGTTLVVQAEVDHRDLESRG
jgi:hypothetical protein